MKKILSFIVIALMFFCFGMGISNAQTKVPTLNIIDESSTPNWNQTMKGDSKYAFTFTRPTSMEVIGSTVTCTDALFTGVDKCFVAKKGAGVIYRNIGVSSSGQKVDLKIELQGYTLSTEKSGDVEDGYIGVRTDAIDVHHTNLADAVYKFTLLESSTDTPIKLDGFISFVDIDRSQYMSVTSDDGTINDWYVVEEKNNKGFANSDDVVGSLRNAKNWEQMNDSFNSNSCSNNLKEDTGLYNLTDGIYTFVGRKGYLNGRGSINSYAMGTFDNTSTFIVTFGRCATTAKNETFGVGDALLKIELPQPTKEVSKEKLEVNEEFTYTIKQYIPYQRSANYYKSYVLTDTLEDYLQSPNAKDIKVTDKDGNDVTNNFDITVDGQTITVTSKDTDKAEFYGQYYSFVIPTKVTDTIPGSSFDENSNYIIPNHATATIEYKDSSGKEEKDTNEVNVTVHKEPQIVVVPPTSASIPLIISLIGVLLVIISVLVCVKTANNKEKK